MSREDRRDGETVGWWLKPTRESLRKLNDHPLQQSIAELRVLVIND